MPDFFNQYERVRSAVTGLFIDKPMLTVSLMMLNDADVVAANLRMRLDTGADISSVPLELAADVLGMNGGLGTPGRAQIRGELRRAMQGQGLRPTNIRSASGSTHRAYPLRVPVELRDDSGTNGKFESTIAFVDGQDAASLLAGLADFLDKFDIRFEATRFSLHARPGTGVTCSPYASSSTMASP